MKSVKCLLIHGDLHYRCLFDVSVCSVTGSLASSDHTTLALASTLSIFLVLFAVIICILVLGESSL